MSRPQLSVVRASTHPGAVPPTHEQAQWYWRGRRHGARDAHDRYYPMGYVAGWRWGVACGALGGIVGSALAVLVAKALHWL